MEFCLNWEKHLSLAKVSLNISYETSSLGIKPQPHSQGLLAYRRFEEEFLTEQVSETKQDNLRKNYRASFYKWSEATSVQKLCSEEIPSELLRPKSQLKENIYQGL